MFFSETDEGERQNMMYMKCNSDSNDHMETGFLNLALATRYDSARGVYIAGQSKKYAESIADSNDLIEARFGNLALATREGRLHRGIEQ